MYITQAIHKERAETIESELRSLLDSVKNDLSITQEKNKELLSVMEDAAAAYEKKISNITSQLDEEKSSHASTVEDSAKLAKEIEAFVEETKALTATNAALKEECSKHVENNEELTSQLEALHAELAAIQESNDASASELVSTKQQLSNLSSQLALLQEQHNAKEQQLSTATEELSGLKAKLADAEKSAACAAMETERTKHASEKALAEERKRISKELDKHTAAHKIELDKIIKERDALSLTLFKEKETAAKEIAALQVKLDSANHDWKEVDAKLQQANARLTAASKDLQTKECQLLAASQDNSKLVQELEDTAAKLEEKEIALQGISMYAQQQGKTGGATTSAMKRTRPAVSPHHPKGAITARRSVRFKDPPASPEINVDEDEEFARDMSQKNDHGDDWDDDGGYGDIVKNLLRDDDGMDDNDEDEEEDDGDHLKTDFEAHDQQQDQQAYHGQGPIIHEEDSDDSDSENAENLPARTFARGTGKTGSTVQQHQQQQLAVFKTSVVEKKGGARGGSKRGSRFSAMKHDVPQVAGGRVKKAKLADGGSNRIGKIYMQGPGASFFKIFNDLQNASPDSNEVMRL